jgi:hypothetical protein
MRSSLLGMLLAGCVFAPDIGDGTVQCGAGGSCPPGFACGPDDLCHRADASVAPGADATAPPGCGDGVVDQGEVCFLPGSLSGGFIGARRLAAGRLDAGDTTDLTVIGEGWLYLALGSGGGGFTMMDLVPAMTPGDGLEVAQLDGTGFDDVAYLGTDPEAVTVLLSEGQPVTSYPVGTSPTAMDSGDFDKNGHADLVVAHDDQVLALMNAGPGMFASAPPTAIPARAVIVASMNTDDDDALDVVVTPPGAGAVTVLAGNEMGEFSDVGGVSVTEPVDALAAADFDGNGTIDVVVALPSGVVTLLAGDGRGNLMIGGAVSLANAPDTSALLAADVDGDTVVDLLLADERHHQVVVILSPFVPIARRVVELPCADAPSDLLVVDATGDDLPDLITAHPTTGEISVMAANP